MPELFASISALPHLLQNVRIEQGSSTLPFYDTIQHAQQVALHLTTSEHLDSIAARFFLGEASQVEDRLRSFAAHLGIQEVMIAASSGVSDAADPTTAPSRERTLTLLAERFDLNSAAEMNHSPAR